MAISPINSVIGTYSFDAGADVSALLDAVKASVTNELTGALKNSSFANGAKRQQLTAMLSAREVLPALVADQAGMVTLGTDLVSGQAQLDSFSTAGLSLSANTAYQMQKTVTDKNGNVTLTGKHLATQAEMTAALAASLVTSSTAPAIDTRQSTDGAGNRAEYTLYKDEGKVTATKASVDAAIAAIPVALPALQAAVRSEDARLQALGKSVLAQIGDDGKRVLNPRKAENNRVDDRQGDIRKAVSTQVKREFERVRHDTVKQRRDD